MFAQTLPIPTPSGPFIILSRVDSTNNYAMAKLHAAGLQHGTTLMAFEQTAGKGQRGKTWLASPGESITMSIVFSLPRAFSADQFTKIQSFPFLLSASVALGCYDFIKGLGVHDIKIKWPNDLYIGDRKAGGILIENIVRSTEWAWAVIGVGINVNQRLFPGNVNATSIAASLSAANMDVFGAGRKLRTNILARLSGLNEVAHQQVMIEFNQALYKRGEEVRLRKEAAVFTTTVKFADIHGKLHTSDVVDRSYSVGEVEMVR